MRSLVVTFAGVLALAAPATARAQGSYRSAPLGGRSALMGNTGVVLARDGAAPFLNPATTVWIRDDSVAFSVNLYSAEYTVIPRYHAPGPIDRRFGALSLDATSFTALRIDALPSTFCIFLNTGGAGKPTAEGTPPDRVPQKLSVCIGTAERRVIQGAALQAQGRTSEGETTRASTFLRQFGRVLVGPSYAAAISDRISFGAALHVVSTTATTILSADSTTIEGANALSSGYGAVTSAQSFDVAALVGVTYALDRATTLGLSLSPPTAHVAGSADATLRTQVFAGADASETRVGQGSFSAPVPMHVSAGLGVVLPRVRLELDASYYVAKVDAFSSHLSTTRIHVAGGAAVADALRVDAVEGANDVVDTSLGIEVLMGKQLSFLLGFSEDFSASPPPPEVLAFGAIETSRENRAMVSIGFASSVGDSELAAGVQLSTTWGKTIAVDSYVLPNEPMFTDERTYGALLVIAGSTSLRTIKTTMKKLTAPAP